MNRTQTALVAIIYRVEHGHMTAEHVTRSLRPESALGEAWTQYLSR